MESDDNGTPTGHRERLRQRFSEAPAQLTDAQRLELLLTFAIPRRDMAPIAARLLERFGSLDQLFSAPNAEIAGVEGIGEHSALLIRLVATLRGNGTVAGHKAATSATRPTAPSVFESDRQTVRPAAPSAPAARPEPEQIVRETVFRHPRDSVVAPMRKKQMPKRARTGLFSAGVFDDAARLVSKIPLDADPDAARKFLEREGLHYSGATTRNRYASYIVVRLFPAKRVDTALLRFARRFDGTQALRDVVFHRFMTAEPVLAAAINEVLLPALGRGHMMRIHLRRYLAQRFPDAKKKSIDTCAKAIVEALAASKLADVTKTTVTAHFRSIDLRAFAFILHSEFAEPGVHKMEAIESSTVFKAMLWPADAMKTALYELRNQGLISKVSEIDSVRQFTTKFILDQIVDALVARGDTK
jgi:hypothetical protein